jgi:hypothetical protein
MKLSTVRQLSEKFPAFSQASIRWIIFNAQHNGASSFIHKIGRKIVIDDDAFLQWVSNHKGA